MPNPVNLLHLFSQRRKTHPPLFSLNRSVFFLLTVATAIASVTPVQAETPETAPPQLKETLAQIDAAANGQNLESLTQFYSPEFKNSDGLTRTGMEQGLQQLWERYPQLTYRTELQSWENDGNAIVAETLTQISGTQPGSATPLRLESTLRSRQRYEDRQIVSSEILSEQTQITSGTNPPKVQVNLPEQVRIGQQFPFDVIVEEPLGDNLLLGTAVEEPVQSDRYSQPTDFELELLPAGGIFKLGKAPIRAEDRWISAVLISSDGTTMITRRLQVVDRAVASTTPSK